LAEREEWEDNREVKRRPKQGKFYCLGCDGYIVHPGETCLRCGWKDRTAKGRRNKK